MTEEAVEHHVIMIGEVQIKPCQNRSNRSAVLPLLMTQDTATDELLATLRSWINHRFAVVLKKIGDDEHPAQQQRRTTGDSDTTNETVGATSAPEGISARTLSEFEKRIAYKNQKICQVARNDPQFRGFLFDFRKEPFKHNPVEAKEWVRQEQHRILRVDSCAHIYPGTYSERMLEWLMAAFEADKHRLPIQPPPEEVS